MAKLASVAGFCSIWADAGFFWQILGNIEKSIPLPRTFLSQLPNDLGKYDTARKKKLFISILLPIILRGNEIVIEERISMKTAFYENNIEKIEYYSKRYKVKKLINQCCE